MIVGAEIAGLTCAVALRRAGAAIEVLERTTELAAVGCGNLAVAQQSTLGSALGGPRSRTRGSATGLGLAVVTHAKEEDNELLVVDLVDDPVVAGTDPPLAQATDEPGRGWWSGFDSEQLNGGLDASPHIGVEPAKLARG